MVKLLRSNLIRIMKSATFWICASIYLIYGIMRATLYYLDDLFLGNEHIYNMGFSGSPLTGYFILIFMCVIIGTDFNNNTIRNKILIGHSKTKIYLSNVLAFSICAIILNLIFLCITIPFSKTMALIYLLEAFFHDTNTLYVAKLIVLSVILNILTVTFFVSTFALIAMNIKNTVLSILCSIALNTVAIIATYIFLHIIIDLGGSTLWYEVIYLSPAGIDVSIANGNIIDSCIESWPFFIFITALLIILTVITATIGVKIFKKSNIK